MELTAKIGVDRCFEARSSIDEFSDQAEAAFGLLGYPKSAEVVIE
jgi:hypothetical protein